MEDKEITKITFEILELMKKRNEITKKIKKLRDTLKEEKQKRGK